MGELLISDLKLVRTLIEGPVRGWIIMAIIGSVVLAGLDTLGVAAMLPLMQIATGSDPTVGVLGFVSRTLGTADTQPMVLAIALVVGLAFTLKSVVTIWFRWWLLGRTTQLEAAAATDLMRRYMLAPFSNHRQREVAVIHRNIVTAVYQTFGQVVLGLIGVLADILTLASIGIVLLFLSPLTTVFTVVLFASIGWMIQRSMKKRHFQIGKTIAQSDLDAWAALMPGLNGFREARLSSAAELFVGRFSRAKTDRANANRLSSIVSELPKYILEIGFIVGIAGMAALLFGTATPESALAILGVFAAAATRLLPTMNRAVATVGVVRAGRAGLEILAKEVASLDQAGYHSEQRKSAVNYSGDVVLDNISFKFLDSADEVLSHISTTIVQGKTTAFVGSSGAGKSTLLDILLGLLEPTSGTVQCGGRDIFADLPSWYSGLGIVPQDVYLLDDSVTNNIAFGQEPQNLDPNRLSEAIALAELDSLIAEMPEGLDTRLGERGVRLSGGQRQRIGIARALYRRPDILVLDEATSALDNATERRISDTIDSLSGTMTIVIVAHRLSTIKKSDKVVFMSDGQIEAEGTFDALQLKSKEFSDLVALGKLG